MASLSFLRRVLLRFLALLLTGIMAVTLAQNGDHPAEEEVKAAFVLNFIRFVNWPVSHDAGELTICSTDDWPLAQAVDKMSRGKQVAGRRLRLRIAGSDLLEDCSVILVNEEHPRKAAALLAQVAAKPVLTIGEGPGFVTGGGMLALVRERQKIAFDANVTAIQRSGLDVSSSLLRLARNVRRDGSD